MSKQVIAVDIDDVLATSVREWIRYSNEQWGTRLTVDDYDEDWAKMWQVDHDEANKRAQHIYKSGIVADFKYFQEAKEVLLELAQEYKLVITTSRVEHIRQHTLEWINKHFENIFEEVHLAGFYDKGIQGAVKLTKAKLLQSIGADYLIDDQPKHCFAAAEVGIKSILFGDYKWSRGLESLPQGVTRCLDWEEVREYFAHVRQPKGIR